MLRKTVSQTVVKRLQSLQSPINSEAIKQKFQFKNSQSTIQQALSKFTSSNGRVCLNGWIDNKPKKIGKKLIFGKFRDTNGDLIQIVDTDGIFLKNSNTEDCIQIEGFLKEKHSKTEISQTKEYEINLEHLQLLNRANKTPSQLKDLLDASSAEPKSSSISTSFPQEYRYLQLRTKKFQEIIKKRYLANKSVRSILDEHGFTEVETPLLFKSTPEGAREFLVPTRSTTTSGKTKPAQPLFYALPQSPQQYKQLLMASGVYRYFQIAKCFRDEDLRSDRQPEFTQIDMELSFANADQVMGVVSDVVLNTWKAVTGEHLGTIGPLSKKKIIKATNVGEASDSKTGLTKMTYQEVMTKYGIDKPDMRFVDLEFVNLKEFGVSSYAHSKFPVFEVLVLRKAFTNDEELSKWKSLLNDANEYNNRKPHFVPIKTSKDSQEWFNHIPQISVENPTLVNKFLRLQEGDILLGCDRESDQLVFENPTPLGRARQLITSSEIGCKKFKAAKAPVGIWVVEFPLFTPIVKDADSASADKHHMYPEYEPHKYSATHHPFTMCKPEHLPLLLSETSTVEQILKCKSLHYDLVVNGVELGGGSVRVHDPVLQKTIFTKFLHVHDDKLFKHLLDAFEMGCPPHAGFAIGFDRMCAMMLGLDSIRDVIAFPKSVTGQDLVVGSPTACTEEQLREYNIQSSG
ncbi:hypothetical protein ACO0QE_002472 [Hanseniaspora vineae]